MFLKVVHFNKSISPPVDELIILDFSGIPLDNQFLLFINCHINFVFISRFPSGYRFFTSLNSI